MWKWKNFDDSTFIDSDDEILENTLCRFLNRAKAEEFKILQHDDELPYLSIIYKTKPNGITQPASKRSKKRGNRSNQTQGRMGGDVPSVA